MHSWLNTCTQLLSIHGILLLYFEITCKFFIFLNLMASGYIMVIGDGAISGCSCFVDPLTGVLCVGEIIVNSITCNLSPTYTHTHPSLSKYISGARATIEAYPFGLGAGPIFLETVQCLGDEETLLNCSHNGIRNHDCVHTEDAGAACEGMGARMLVGHVPPCLRFFKIGTLNKLFFFFYPWDMTSPEGVFNRGVPKHFVIPPITNHVNFQNFL